VQKKRYTEEQIVRILGEAEAGVKVEELVRKYRVRRSTIYRWRSKYGGMEVSDVRRLKELEEENRRLKKIVGDLTLEIDAVKSVSKKMVRPTARKKVVAEPSTMHGLRERRSCTLAGISRSASRYERQEDPPELIAWLKDLAVARPRWGNRGLHMEMRRGGLLMNLKKVYRVYCEHGMQVQCRNSRASRQLQPAGSRGNRRGLACGLQRPSTAARPRKGGRRRNTRHHWRRR